MNDEVVEKVLGLDIKVKTNTGKEKIIRLSNIIGHIGSSFAINHDDYDDITKMEFKLDCLGYTMEIVDA